MVDIPVKIRATEFEATENYKRQFRDSANAARLMGENFRLEGTKLNQAMNLLNQLKTEDTSGITDPKKKDTANAMKFLSGEFAKMGNSLKGILTKSFDVLSSVYKELKKSSPLLQAVENLFNIAMQLFFMPLGNKLGEILIPAVIELLDKVVSMWDELGDGGLGDMFSKAIQFGVTYLAEFFADIGSSLAEQGGIVGSIGNALLWLSKFIETKGSFLINTVLNLSVWIMEHIGTIIFLIGTFMSMHYALQLATMAVIAAGSGLYAPLAIAAGAVALGGIGVSGYVANFAMAEGGYVPATEGGSLHLLGEGGEGEYVIPESKLNQFGGNSYTINISGITTDELKTMIRDVVSDEISQSRLRSGF